MTRDQLLAKLRYLRDEIAQQAESGVNVDARYRAYNAASEALLEDDLEAARWVLAAERVPTGIGTRSSRLGKHVAIRLADFRSSEKSTGRA